MLIFTYPAQEINCLNLITMEDGSVAPLLKTFLQLSTHFAKSLNSNFLKGLTYSALSSVLQ